MNKVELIGFAGMDPEYKTIGDKAKVAKFSLATSESYKKNNEWVKQTHWHRIVGWNKLADDIFTTVKKGKKLSIMGKISYRFYENTEGKRMCETEIIALEVNEALK